MISQSIHTTESRRNTVSLAYSNAKKVLILNLKGGVGKSTVTAGLMSHLVRSGYNVELIDFDKQKSSHDWAVSVGKCRSQSYNPSLKSFSSIASTLKVKRDSDFVILDSPSNFTEDDMLRYTRFVDAIIVPMQPSPVDLHASLPFIHKVINSGVLSRCNISLSFIINRCQQQDNRVDTVAKLLGHFRNYPLLGRMSESEKYQEAFYYKSFVEETLDPQLWVGAEHWLCETDQ
ncbi:ParA family protein [Vibrio sp. RE86]|nr:ParA family protein [Vibrio sp. RE86]